MEEVKEMSQEVKQDEVVANVAEEQVQPDAPAEAEAPKEADSAEEAKEAEGSEEANPFLEYMRNAFAKPHIDEFMATLTDDQKSFIYVFCSGFETAIGRHIVGVYDSAYIEGYHFTKEVLDSLRIVIKPVDVKDSDLKFTIVAQLV
jgi:hypothetical protein